MTGEIFGLTWNGNKLGNIFVDIDERKVKYSDNVKILFGDPEYIKKFLEEFKRMRSEKK